MRSRSLLLAVAAAAAATLLLGSVALADSLTITFSGQPSYDSKTNSLNGSQTTTPGWSPSTPYAGTYSATGTYNYSTGCITNPQVVFDYPSANGNPARLTVDFQSPLCNGSSGSIKFTILSGSGVFSGATGSGTANLSSGVLTFNTSTGSFDPPGGSGILGTTPELDSLLLFGTGALGMAGYALTRVRARRAGKQSA